MECISIKKAYIKGLVKVGEVITTNGDSHSSTTDYFTGDIVKIFDGEIYIRRDDGTTGRGSGGLWVVSVRNAKAGIKIKKSKLEVDKMVKGVAKDVKGFVQENRYVLYWISLILLADHFILGGQCKEKLLGTFNALIDKVNSVIKKNTD